MGYKGGWWVLERENKAAKWIQKTEPLGWINTNISLIRRLTYNFFFARYFHNFFCRYCFVRKKKPLKKKRKNAFYSTFYSRIVRRRHEVWQWHAFTYTYFRLIFSWINSFAVGFRFAKNSLSTRETYGCVEKHYGENVNVNLHKRFVLAYKDSMCQARVDSLTRNWRTTRPETNSLA